KFIDGLNYSKTIIQKHPKKTNSPPKIIQQHPVHPQILDILIQTKKSSTPHQKSSNNILYILKSWKS
ncbi:hypothetical protein, partial [Aphanizomenon flos-aquae]|uniref:hypothetical protein n=1 Tax=Aphanizomenon flos-aquae TaxID=1176 RepID=UPI001A7E548D